MFSILLYFKVQFYLFDGKAELQQPLLKSKETFLLNHNTCFFYKVQMNRIFFFERSFVIL